MTHRNSLQRNAAYSNTVQHTAILCMVWVFQETCGGVILTLCMYYIHIFKKFPFSHFQIFNKANHIHIHGGVESWDALSLEVIFHKRGL